VTALLSAGYQKHHSFPRFSKNLLSDELRGDEIAPKASLSWCPVALHSMTANNGESHEGADGDYIPRRTG
jgi:hypothetical protein